MNKKTRQQFAKQQRHGRVRAKISGTTKRPRLSVYRSLNYIYAQIIDDVKGITIVSATDKDMKSKGTKSEKAKQVGLEIAKLAKEKKVEKIVFDRGINAYHGRVKELAEGAREGGLVF